MLNTLRGLILNLGYCVTQNYNIMHKQVSEVPQAVFVFYISSVVNNIYSFERTKILTIFYRLNVSTDVCEIR